MSSDFPGGPARLPPFVAASAATAMASSTDSPPVRRSGGRALLGHLGYWAAGDAEREAAFQELRQAVAVRVSLMRENATRRATEGAGYVARVRSGAGQQASARIRAATARLKAADTARLNARRLKQQATYDRAFDVLLLDHWLPIEVPGIAPIDRSLLEDFSAGDEQAEREILAQFRAADWPAITDAMEALGIASLGRLDVFLAVATASERGGYG